MATTAKAINNLLMPTPKDLDKALAVSADRARRMAEAFGLKVPGVAEKTAKAPSHHLTQRLKAKA
jgi:hypothetical protein